MKHLYEIKDCGLDSKGHYSLASEHNGTLYISGQLSFDEQTGQVKTGTVKEETEQILGNIERILNEFDYKKENIIKMTILIPSVEDWAEANKAYADFFGDHKPARIVIPCGKLNYGLKVEIEGIAVK